MLSIRVGNSDKSRYDYVAQMIYVKSISLSRSFAPPEIKSRE